MAQNGISCADVLLRNYSLTSDSDVSENHSDDLSGSKQQAPFTQCWHVMCINYHVLS